MSETTNPNPILAIKNDLYFVPQLVNIRIKEIRFIISPFHKSRIIRVDNIEI